MKPDQDGDTIADYNYDKAGNLTIDAENQRFVFDAENRMKEFFRSSNMTQTPDAKYSYDGEGRRVKKVSGNRTTIFVYNISGSLVAEYDSQPVTNPQVSYLTADHLGSPRVITDGRGAVIARHDYMAFGSDITETIGNVGGRTTTHGYNSADSIRKRYTGYEHDDESKLDFAQARYYNSSHGRFTSVDPLTASANVKNPQTFNRYSYVLNSPYKYIDPLGLLATKPGQSKKCQKRDLTCAASNSTGKRLTHVNDEGASPQAGSAERPPITTVQVNGVNYVGTLESSTVFRDDTTSSVSIKLNYSWATQHTDENGKVTETAVSQEVGDILNDGLGRMATNSYNTHIALYNLTTVEKVSITLEGTASLGTKYKKLTTTGGEVGGSITVELSNPNAVKSKTRLTNDEIQSQMAIDIGEKTMSTAWSGSSLVKVGDQKVSSGETLSSQFAQIARDEANKYSRSKYKEIFSSRIQFLSDY